MTSSFRAFMDGIIDYAGLFPPAELSLDTSIQKYSDYRKSDDAWMLGRYIIPAERLSELEPYHDSLFQEGTPYEFSILGKKTETISEYREHLQYVIDAIDQFYRTHGDRVTADILEIKLPREAVFTNDDGLLLQVYDETAEWMNESELLPNNVFFEGFFEENWKKEIGLILEVLNNHNKRFEGENYQESGFKLRCGGVESDMFPSLEQVAFALENARAQNVTLKCTAGLHHPIRHYDDSVKTKMHGFFNVFGGAMLGYAHNLSGDKVIEILRDEDPENFSFTDERLKWKDLSVSTQDISELRNVALTSFGSCSFDEPREDLRRLGLLN